MLGPTEARLIAAVLDRAECRGGTEIRRVAAAQQRLRWILAKEDGPDPGGQEELLVIANEILADFLDGNVPVPGSWTNAILSLEEKLSTGQEDEKT